MWFSGRWGALCSGACRCLAALHARSPMQHFQNLPPTPCWQLLAPSGLLAAPHAAFKTPMTSLLSVFCFLSPFLQNLFCSEQAPGPSIRCPVRVCTVCRSRSRARAWPTACVPCFCPACSLQRSSWAARLLFGDGGRFSSPYTWSPCGPPLGLTHAGILLLPLGSSV